MTKKVVLTYIYYNICDINHNKNLSVLGQLEAAHVGQMVAVLPVRKKRLGRTCTVPLQFVDVTAAGQSIQDFAFLCCREGDAVCV